MNITNYEEMKQVLLRTVMDLNACWSQFVWGTVARLIPKGLDKDSCEAIMQYLRTSYSDNREEVLYDWNIQGNLSHQYVYCNDFTSFTKFEVSTEPGRKYAMGLAWLLLIDSGEQYEIENSYNALTYFRDVFLRDCAELVVEHIDLQTSAEEENRLYEKVTGDIDNVVKTLERVLRHIDDSKVYKGIFWIKDIATGDMICAKIPCDVSGKIIRYSDMPLNSKRGDNYNHEKTWDSFDERVTEGKKFNYYPRGRVEIRKGKAKIYLNPNLLDEKLIALIQDEFLLSYEKGITDIKVIPDYS
ncbi:MAG: hypothetical protein ACI39H_00115 [Lachnospiraceae bacterium]